MSHRVDHRPECHGSWNVMADSYEGCDCIIKEIALKEEGRLRLFNEIYGKKVLVPEWATQIIKEEARKTKPKYSLAKYFQWLPKWFKS